MKSFPAGEYVSARPASIEKLTASLVDYAGLFPPAALDMEAAASRYAQARTSVGRWLLGSFVVPVSRCEEFEAATDAHLGQAVEDAWSASVILTRDALEEVALLRTLRDRWQGRIEIGSVEIAPLSSPVQIVAIAEALPRDLAAFFEVAVDDELDSRLETIASVGAFAKIRTGGMEAAAFPDVVDLARFLESAEERGVPFKATAGLHHLMRGPQKISPQADSASVWMHGYLNLAVAAALLHAGKARGTELIEVLSESSSAAFEITAKSISWRDRTLVMAEIERCRRAFYQSFGSCSFEEPLEELGQLLISRNQMSDVGQIVRDDRAQLASSR